MIYTVVKRGKKQENFEPMTKIKCKFMKTATKKSRCYFRLIR